MAGEHFGLRAKARDKKLLLGTFVCIPSPAVVEIVGRAGFDFLAIDTEHSQVDRASLENLIRAADSVEVAAIVRVVGPQQECIGAALDAGAAGILVPRIATAFQAQAVVAATRYPPDGERGLGPSRATGYGASIQEYVARANDDVLLAIQIETAEGLSNVAEIAKTPGIDVIFIGPGDLAMSLGVKNPTDNDRLNSAISTIVDETSRSKCAAGIFVPDPSAVADWADRGVIFQIISGDISFLSQAASASWKLACPANGPQ